MNRRQKEKYPALNPGLNLRSRHDEIEVDYLHKLSEEEKDWLNKFNEEYVNASLDRQNLDNNLHKTKKLKKSIDKKNNVRKEDIYTMQKASGKLHYLEDIKNKQISLIDNEDKLIEKIDSKMFLSKKPILI